MTMDMAPHPARPRLNPYTRALRRERILARRRLGWSYADIAGEEGLSEQRIQQIVSQVLQRQSIDEPRDHALIQLVRLEGAQALAAELVAAGDLKAIRPFLDVLERIDRHRKAGAAKQVYDAAARERLFAKLNRVAARLEAERERKAAKQAAAVPPGPADGEPSSDPSI